MRLGENGRAGEIRTHDLLHPMQARYQATLRPEPVSGQKAGWRRLWQVVFLESAQVLRISLSRSPGCRTCWATVELFRVITKWVWPFGLAAMIVVASGRSQVAAPELMNFDKVAHFGLFGLLATLVARNGWPARRAWVPVLLVSLFGLTDEWHQSFTPGRSVEVADWVADTMGAMVAVVLYVRWVRYRDWLERPLFVRQRRIEKPAPLVPNRSV